MNAKYTHEWHEVVSALRASPYLASERLGRAIDALDPSAFAREYGVCNGRYSDFRYLGPEWVPVTLYHYERIFAAIADAVGVVCPWCRRPHFDLPDELYWGPDEPLDWPPCRFATYCDDCVRLWRRTNGKQIEYFEAEYDLNVDPIRAARVIRKIARTLHREAKALMDAQT